MSINSQYVYNKGVGHGYIGSGSFSNGLSMLETGQFIGVESRGARSQVSAFTERLNEVLSDTRFWNEINKQLDSYGLQFKTGNIFCLPDENGLDGKSKFYLDYVTSKLSDLLCSVRSTLSFNRNVQASIVVLFPIPTGEYGYLTVGSNILVKDNDVLNYPEVFRYATPEWRDSLSGFGFQELDLMNFVRPDHPTAIYQKGVMSDLRNCQLMSQGLFEIFSGSPQHPLVKSFQSSIHVFDLNSFASCLNYYLPNGYFWLGLGRDGVDGRERAQDFTWSTFSISSPAFQPFQNDSDTIPIDTLDVHKALSDYDSEPNSATTRLFASPVPEDPVQSMSREGFEPLIPTQFFNTLGQPVDSKGKLIEAVQSRHAVPSVRDLSLGHGQFRSRGMGDTRVFSISDPRFLTDPNVFDPGTRLINMKDF